MFCSSPGVAASLFLADPSVTGDVFEANYGSGIRGGGGGGGGGRSPFESRSGSGSEDDISLVPLLLQGGARGEKIMPAYTTAQQVKPLVLLCCDIDIVSTGISVYLQEAVNSNKDAQMIRLPVNASARGDLLRELKGSKKLVGLQLEHGLGWVYTVPPSRRQGGRVREDSAGGDRDRGGGGGGGQQWIMPRPSVWSIFVCVRIVLWEEREAEEVEVEG